MSSRGDSVSARRRVQQQRASVQHRTGDLVCRRHPFPSSPGPRPVLARGQRDPTRADVSTQGGPGKPLPSAKPAPGPASGAARRGEGIIGSSRRRQPRRGRATVAEPKGAKPLRWAAWAVVSGRGIYWAPPDASGPGRAPSLGICAAIRLVKETM